MNNKEKILNEVGMLDYRKGLNYYEDIYFDSVTKENTSKTYSYFVQSESDYYKKYNVRITIDNNEIERTYCNCRQFKTFGSCKHVAVVLIKNEKTIFDGSTFSLEKLGNNILNIFVDKNEKMTVKKQAKIEIYIKRYKRYYYNDDYYYEVKLKIGTNKMYMLNKKISTFLDSYTGRTNDTINFGKDFLYNRNEYYFNDEDKKLLNYLTKTRVKEYDLTYINDEKISEFIQNLGEKEFTIEGYGTFNKIDKGSPFNILLSQKDNNYNLEVTNIGEVLVMGINPTYAIYKSKIYELNNDMVNFLYVMYKNGLKEFQFSKKELDKFTNGLLKIIKDNVEVDNSLKEEIVICKTPLVKLYFDYYYNAIICNLIFVYNNTEVNYFDTNNNVLRDRSFENDVLTDILSYNFILEDNKLIMDDIDYIGNFIEEDLITLTDKYEVFTSDKIKKTKIVNSNIRSSFGIGEDNILSYNFNLGNIDNKEITNILNDLKTKKKYYRLKSGDLINLEEDTNLDELNKLMNDMDLNSKDLEEGTGIIPKYRAIYLDSLRNSKYSIIDTNNLFDSFINNFNKYKDIEVDLTKKDLSILRDYQTIGVKWLYNIYKCELGSILADEMGLGKSIQFIYFIKQVLKDKKDAKILIVSPTSLVFNWEKEFEKFGSELKYKVIYGMKEKRHNDLSSLENINVIITTYGMVREDIDIYENLSFEVMAIDEAQNIKNISAMISKAVKKINARVKIAITGTPLENSVMELWSIFDYIMPGYLTNVKKFQSKYNIKDVDEDNLNKLNDLNTQIKPFILRRKKSDVLKDLPPKIENNIYIDLNENQKKIYMAEVEKTKKEMEDAIAEEGFIKAKFKILQLLTKLRQICIDPRIVYENYSYESSKIKEAVNLIKTIVANNHKLLIFTSFKTALNILNNELNNAGISTYVIAGEIKADKRMELVDKFNSDSTNAFLITLQSGGTGLNLTSADVVMHLDLWWNPQVENQATDRAHRIGQKNTVEVIKLVCKGTIEEKILELQNKKKILTDKLIEGEDMDKNIISSLTEEDIKSLFIYDNEEEYEIVK